MAYTRVTRTENRRGALAYAYGKSKGHNGSEVRNDLIASVNILPGIPAEVQMQKYWNRARANHKTQVIRVVQSFSISELNPDEPAFDCEHHWSGVCTEILSRLTGCRVYTDRR